MFVNVIVRIVKEFGKNDYIYWFDFCFIRVEIFIMFFYIIDYNALLKNSIF